MASIPFAGMPVPLPLEIPFRRDASGMEMRLQAISFFLLALVLCVVVVWRLWNYLGRDVAWLPKLTLGRSFALVMLWGLAVFIVLTMISGARELMTPGAWKRDGLTYTLADAAESETAEARRQGLERLRLALWHFAAKNAGRFPSESEQGQIAEGLWLMPQAGGLRYRYLPGRSVNDAAEPLVIEPEVEPGLRWVLFTNGEIAAKTSADIAVMLRSEGSP